MALLVVKLGGAVAGDPLQVRTVADELGRVRAAGHRAVVVHGGGPQLDRELAALGEPAAKVAGLRVTSPRAAAVVQRVLDGIGADLARQLAAAGLPARHVPSALGAFPAHPKRVPEGDLGRVGTATAFRASLEGDAVPVVTPVGLDEAGPLNLNADEGARAVAASLRADWLVLATDVAAVRGPQGEDLERLTPSEARALVAAGAAKGGMVPKLENALAAIDAGVGRVLVTRLEPGTLEAALAGSIRGTLIAAGGPPAEGLKARFEGVMVPNYATPAIEIASGRGAHVTDTAGRRYVDLMAGVAVNVLGHAHPAVVEAVGRQVATLGHTSNLYANGPSLRLAERLQRKAGGHRVLFTNSGTEANEAALKLVRRHAHAQGIPDAVVLAFDHSFHGRTAGALALTGQPHYHEGFQPLPGQIVHLPFNDPAALEAAFGRLRVAGVFFEAVQGEGGVTPMEPAFAAALARLAPRHGALLVADEVQTGVGRTGAFFGFEADGLRPDVVTMAKALGGGLPLGAMLARPEAARLLGPGSHGCTFGGNPVACAAGNAVLDVVEREGLPARAARLGREFQESLQAHGVASRGRGLLLGVPLPAPRAADVVSAMRAEGYLVGQAGPSVVRLAPPLVIGDELSAAAPALARAVRAAAPSPA